MPDYVAIVNGRVTDVVLGASAIPPSSAGVLYWDVTGLSPQPQVDWYFAEPCNVFSALPPVIPPGDLAPPYPPGEEPPDRDDFEEIEPGPVREALLGYHLTALHAHPADTAVVVGDDPEAEVTPLWRTTLALDNTCGLRLQAHVVVPDSVRLILKGSFDNGATWEYLNTEYEGPFLDVTNAGEAVGPFVNIDPAFATGDVLVSVFARASGSPSAILGNVHVMHALKLDDGVCPLYEIEVDGCAVPAAIFADDLSGYASWAAFYAAVEPSNPSFDAGVWSNIGFESAENDPAFLDFGTTFAGNPTLAAPLADLGFLDLVFSRIASLADPGEPEATFFCVFALPDDWSPSDTGPIADGLSNFTLAAVNYDNAGGFIAAWGGQVYWVWEEYVTSGLEAPVALGPVSDWRGGWKQLLVRGTKSGSTCRTRIYLNDACDAPTVWADLTNTDSTSGGGLSGVGVFQRRNGDAGSSGLVRVAQLAFDTDPAVFGL